MAYGQFDRVPNHYAGPIIQRLKEYRRAVGRKSLAPTLLRLGELEVVVPRHFGFCFGVERAIHMAFSAVEREPDRRTFLVSEIIHNPLVNRELQERGVRFLFDEEGRRQVPEPELTPEDVVLIPAFGTTLQIEESLGRSGLDPADEGFRDRYDTTCPFVSKVWKRGEELGRAGYTVVVHGKFRHEETQATQSHIRRHAPTLVVLDRVEAMVVHDYIVGAMDLSTFRARFSGKWSEGFDPECDLRRVAVVNQTTMLAEETREVAEILRRAMRARYGEENLEYHCADTTDTLCYATNQNQNAVRTVLHCGARLAVIVGGYNSSNTAHLVEICSASMPSYLIADHGELLSPECIRHFDIHRRQTGLTEGWLPTERPLRVVVTSGASCPDVLMNQVIERLAGFAGYGTEEIDRGLDGLCLLETD
ncbi:MAG: 4-hydroxy-3-methylbut-2-enyl diphosphate reductase [Candidatus Latescibacterota bacterium]|jgi:4-hydroxy-3-methylbut-2-enyl diphosphate reductase